MPSNVELGKTAVRYFTLPSEIGIPSANKKQQNSSASLIPAHSEYAFCSTSNHYEIHNCNKDIRDIFLRAMMKEKGSDHHAENSGPNA
jgi:hypothetical protein